MPFNGSGTYSPPGADFPAVSGQVILASKFNNVINDIATALSSAILKDGTQVLTASLPMAGFKLTGLGAGSANGDSVRFEQLKGWTPIEEKTVSAAATVDFTTGISSTYKAYKLLLFDWIPATDNSDLQLRVSEDGGSNWIATVSYGAAKFTITQTPAVGDVGVGGNFMQLMTGLGNAAGESLSGEITIYNPSGTAVDKLFSYIFSLKNSGAILQHVTGSGRYFGSTNAINGIRLFQSAGNVTSGVAQLYGIKA